MAIPLFRLTACACLLLAVSACESTIRFLDSLPKPAPAQAQDGPATAWSRDLPAPALTPEEIERELARIDFRIIDGRARIARREYVLARAPAPRPQFTPLGNQVYFLEMVFERDSGSSLRGNERVTAHLYYDGTELVFFRDANHNNQFDRYDRNLVRYRIGSKRGPPREIEFAGVTLLIVFER